MTGDDCRKFFFHFLLLGELQGSLSQLQNEKRQFNTHEPKHHTVTPFPSRIGLSP